MPEPVALAALAFDAALGWPAWLYARIGHPVGAFARLIDSCQGRWNRSDLDTMSRRAAGIVTVVLLVGGTLLLTTVSEAALNVVAGPLAWVFIALAAWPALAQRSLHDHYAAVMQALEADDLDGARHAVSKIVGRDTQPLDEAGVARAAIESLAESFCDGIVAPLFWFIVLSLPGLWAYKAINTADSLIGHPEMPFRDFGWAAARGDDALNLIPARLSGALLCLAGGGGWRVLWRDHRKHASPNAGWPEAAMAGALAIRLAGPVSYDGQWHAKAWIGVGGDADLLAMRKASRVYLRACAILWVAAGGWAWLR